MLSSYRVLDLTDDRGIVAGFILAGLGAEVIAVEPAEGSRARRRGPFAGADAACGALLALTERARSGVGQHVDVSAQISTAQATQSYILSEAFHSTRLERYGGGVRLGEIKLPLVFPAADGYVAITF